MMTHMYHRSWSFVLGRVVTGVKKEEGRRGVSIAMCFADRERLGVCRHELNYLVKRV